MTAHAFSGKPDSNRAMLLSVKLNGTLRGTVFDTKIEQRFCNPSDRSIDFTHTLPLPWGAVLLGVSIELGDKQLVSLVLAKQEPEEILEPITSGGDGNSEVTLETNDDQTYQLTLRNLGAHQCWAITLSYAEILQFDDKGLRLLVPSIIAKGCDERRNIDDISRHIKPNNSDTMILPVGLELRLHGGLAQARVDSPSHAIQVTHDKSAKDSVRVVSMTSAALTSDFVLVIDQFSPTTMFFAARDRVEERVAVLASFHPTFPQAVAHPVHLKILLCCSVCRDDNIFAIQQALRTVIQRLTPLDRLSLSKKHGTRVEHRVRGMWRVSELTKIAARWWVDSLSYDSTKTDLDDALSSTLELPSTSDTDVLVVTDGRIGEIDNLIDLTQRTRQRLFIVGVGTSSGEGLVRRLAQGSGGACDFVAPGDAVRSAVLRMFARMRSTQVTHLAIQWPQNATPDWISPLAPSVFDSDTVRVFALFSRIPIGQPRLLGKPAGENDPLEIASLTIDGRIETTDTLPRLIASARLQSMLSHDEKDKFCDLTGFALSYQLATATTRFKIVQNRSTAIRPTSASVLSKDTMLPPGFDRSDLNDNLTHITRPTNNQNDPVDLITLIADWRPCRPRIRPREHWEQSEFYTGRTPLGVADWLRLTPISEWPTDYLRLQHRAEVGRWVVEWLKLRFSNKGVGWHSETEVVAAFLYLMSRMSTYKMLLAGHRGETKVYEIDRDEAIWSSKTISSTLVKALMVALNSMTALEWPDAVFSLEDGDETVTPMISTSSKAPSIPG